MNGNLLAALLFIPYICDMIKGNESDVADIVFEILAKKEIPLFYIVFSVDKLFVTL